MSNITRIEIIPGIVNKKNHKASPFERQCYCPFSFSEGKRGREKREKIVKMDFD